MSRDILIGLIDTDPDQPRKRFDGNALAELAESMRANGLAVPILLRPVGERFVIVHGERRYRAALSLGWESMPAEVRDVTPDEARWLALVENVQRADLSPIEEAHAYQGRLAEGLTQTALGERIGKSQSYIAQKLRLLKLPDDVQEAVDAHKIAEGHARQILRVNEPARQSVLCERAIRGAWSVTRIRMEVDAALAPKRRSEPTTPAECVIALWEERGRVAGHGPYPEERLPEDHNPPVEIKKLPISAISGLPDDYRLERDLDYPQWLAEIFVTLPPVAVFCIDGRYVLADGEYRMQAAKLLGLKEIECRIYAGSSLLEVYVYGVAANCGGGLPVTKEDWQYTLNRRRRMRVG